MNTIIEMGAPTDTYFGSEENGAEVLGTGIGTFKVDLGLFVDLVVGCAVFVQ